MLDSGGSSWHWFCRGSLQHIAKPLQGIAPLSFLLFSFLFMLRCSFIRNGRRSHD